MTLLRFAVQRRVAHAQITGNKHAVGGDLVAPLQDDEIAHHDLIHGQDMESAVAAQFCPVLCRTRAQRMVFAVARQARSRGHRRHDEHCDNRTDRFIDLRIADEVHRDHECDHHEQDADHRIAECLQKRLPEGQPRRLRQNIRPMDTARRLRLCRCQSSMRQRCPPPRCSAASQRQTIICARRVRNTR